MAVRWPIGLCMPWHARLCRALSYRNSNRLHHHRIQLHIWIFPFCWCCCWEQLLTSGVTVEMCIVRKAMSLHCQVMCGLVEVMSTVQPSTLPVIVWMTLHSFEHTTATSSNKWRMYMSRLSDWCLSCHNTLVIPISSCQPWACYFGPPVSMWAGDMGT